MVLLINVGQRQAATAANLWTKPISLSHRSASSQLHTTATLSTFTTIIYC